MTTTTAAPLISAALPISSAAPQPRILSLRRIATIPTTLTFPTTLTKTPKTPSIRCDVALQSDTSISASEEEELKSNLDKVGSRVRVKAPLKVHHVPKLPEVELTPEMEGVIKQYVGFWQGKRLSANYPFKVQFSIDIEDRGKVKFFVHLREDEFEIID
ncbi:hypothetical protein BVRB_1g009730 [Beta vulgaris subsp. vulgaris]|nr:hypothetical protein BVRB_1g009730 [Beta vulgaris subsp. vulgaris]